jgi:hypothetical protein
MHQIRMQTRQPSDHNPFQIVRDHIRIVRDYCQINGNPEDRWFIGNAYLPLDAMTKYDCSHENKFFVFDTNSPMATITLIRYLESHYGFATEPNLDGSVDRYYILKMLRSQSTAESALLKSV